jgi:hypothetical protein
VKDTIFLRISHHKVEGMTKSLPSLNRGEIPVKLVVSVADSAFREPVIERHVEVVDWRDGIDIADIDFRESVITEEEASIIRQRRLIAMQRILESQGYTVVEPGLHEDDERNA